MKKKIHLTIVPFLVSGLLGCSPEDHEVDSHQPKQGHEEEVHLSEAQLRELGIEVRVAGPATLALEEIVDAGKLYEQPHTALTRYETRAPFSGEVTEGHLVRGELLKEDSQAFIVADLSSVWVNLTVYQKDLPSLRVGQTVRVSPGKGVSEKAGTISTESSRTTSTSELNSSRRTLRNSLSGPWGAVSFGFSRRRISGSLLSFR